MAKILSLETSGTILSVALADGGTVVADRVCREPRMQAALTAPLVKEVLDAAGLKAKDLDAVCVSKGPGSYTGLRVGTSTAKGICFGAGVPLIAVSTLDILAGDGRSEPAMTKSVGNVIPGQTGDPYSCVAKRCSASRSYFVPGRPQLA